MTMALADRDEIRAAVAARYAGLARAAQAGQPVTDGDPDDPAGCAAVYPDAGDLPEGAVRASLGCGNPVAVADLQPGETVLDLGSGGGIDVLLSARRVGPGGKAYGLDMTEEMLDLARANARAAGAGNVEFLRGQIEAIPLPGGSVDVIISNCVINLSTDRAAVFAESFRVLRPGGRLGITDILAEDHLTPVQRRERGAKAGCIAGAPSVTEYRDGLARAGFTGITITAAQQAGDGVHSAIIRAVKLLPMPALDAGMRVEAMTGAHAAAVLAIYQAGIAEGNATFETCAPGWAAFTAARLPAHRYVAITGGRVAGWVAASAVSGRCVYAGVVEHSVYVHPAARGRGIGRRLLEALIGSTEAAGIWTIQSGIFPENTASLALHQAAGFRVVGTRERIGQHRGRWRDVVLIERRSPAVLAVRGKDWPH
jgi:L-amino acid N-acyltransferase YncA/2-polyprenyl-3-methyl-5-hydroxy-6-metoxy-1,4-benzoquinol methylase